MKVRNYAIYNMDGDTGQQFSNVNVVINDEDAPIEYYNLQGIRIMQPTTSGVYIIKKGNQVRKTYIK